MSKAHGRRDKKKYLHTIDSLSAEFNALEQRFNDDSTEVAGLDLFKDLDEKFFSTSYDLIYELTLINNFVAGKMKRYVDLLARIHARYVDVIENSMKINTQVASAERKLRLAVEATCTSNNMIEKLKDSLVEAWRIADASERRESTQLFHHIKEFVGPTYKPEMETGHNLDRFSKEIRIQNYVFRERDRLAGELKEYTKRLETQRYYSESMEKIIETLRATISQQQKRVKKLEDENYKLEHRLRVDNMQCEDKIRHMEKEMLGVQQMNQDLQIFERGFKESSDKIVELNHVIDRVKHKNNNLRLTVSRQMNDIQGLKKVVHDLGIKNKDLRHERDELVAENRNNIRDMKKCEELRATVNRRFHQLSKKNVELTDNEFLLTNEVIGTVKKLNATDAKLDEVIRQRNDSERAKERLRGEVSHLHDTVASLRHDLVIQKSRMQDVQQRLESIIKESIEKDQKIHTLNKLTNDLQWETNDLNKKIETLDADLLDKSQEITNLRDSLHQKHHDLLKLKKLIDTMHSEKIALQKNYCICEQERQNLQSLNVKLSHQVTQLCNQVAQFEKDATALKNQIDQLNNLVKHKQIEIHNKERQLKRMRTDLNEMRVRNIQLQRTVEEDEKRFKLITFNLEEVTKEKSLVGQQMMRRNGELRLQHEKLSMMQSALNRGTTQYNQRVDDIRLLKTEISNLHMTNECLSRAVAEQANIRHEVVRLERQLIREKLNVAVFTEEMKRPFRIHRWRVIHGKDPSQYELIRKNQTLLKRNLRLNVERVNLENKVQDVQRLYDMLKQQLKHLPDANVISQLFEQRRINRRRISKMRAMKAELVINEIDLESRDVIIQQFQQALIKQKDSTTDNVKFAKQPFSPSSQT